MFLDIVKIVGVDWFSFARIFSCLVCFGASVYCLEIFVICVINIKSCFSIQKIFEVYMLILNTFMFRLSTIFFTSAIFFGGGGERLHRFRCH